MQDIMEELMLLMNLTNIKIKETINIKDVDNLILSIEKNKPIPIMFYNKILVELKNTKTICTLCKKIGQYTYRNNIYCWVHAYSLC